LILYVNGDSHSAAGEAVNNFCFANDESPYQHLGRRPHPDNLKVSYAKLLSTNLAARLDIDAESASSNDRIIRTTQQYLKYQTPDLIVIGWSTWEREEWLFDNTYWQINAGGVGKDWPVALQKRYIDWISSVDYKQKEYDSHEKIWQLHNELLGIPHLFFNSYLAFDTKTCYNWNNCYLKPYNKDFTYYHWLANNGFNTVNPNSYHYGAPAHQAWANFLFPYLTKLLK
jgi:hypothetical protein